MITKIKNLINQIAIKQFIKYFLIAVLTVLIFFILAVFLLKNFLSYSFIENKINEYLGLNIEFVSPKTNFDINLNVVSSAHQINLYDKTKKKKIVSIYNPKIIIKPFGFIFKKANFKQIFADKIKIDVSRDTNGKIDILESINVDKLKSLESNKFKLTRLNSSIDKIELNFKDDYKIKSNINFLFDDTRIDISNRKKILKISQTGVITTLINNQKTKANLIVDVSSSYPFKNFNSEKLNFNISLDDINLYIFNDLAKKYISKDISVFDGIVDLKISTKEVNELKKHEFTASIDKLNLTLKNNRKIKPYKEKVFLTSVLDIKKDEIKLEQINLTSNNLSLKANALIEKPFSKKPMVDVNLNLSNTQLNNFLYLLTDDLIFYRPKGIPTLKESNFHALLNGNLNVKFSPLNITGSIKASNVYIPNYPKPFLQNDVNAFFMKDKVRIYTKVYTPQNEYVVVDGVSNLDDSLYGKYSVKSTKKIDLNFAKLYLVPIQQIIGFNIGPVPIMQMSGYGNIDIKTQGTINDAQIFGEFNAYGATAQIEGLNAKITNGKCRLLFNDRNLYFKELKGKIANGDFYLTGKANTKGEVDLTTKISNLALLQALNIFNHSEITKPYKSLGSEIKNAKGDINAEINLKGLISDYEKKEFLNKLSLNGDLNFSDNALSFNNGADIQNINGTLVFGNYQEGNFEFYINNSKFFLDFSSKDSLAKIQSGSNFHLNTVLSSPKFAFLDIFNELNKVVSLKIIDNISEIDFYSKLVLNSQGVLSLKNINFSNFKHNGYVIGLNSSKNKNIKFNSGLVKFVSDKMIFDNFDMSLFDGNIKTNGYIRNFLSKNPSGDLSLSIKDVALAGLDDIFPQIKLERGMLKNGQISLKNRDIKFSSINIDYQNTPMFVNAYLKDAFVSKNLNAEFATILSENSADYIINPYLTYPIKIKGEVPLKGAFKGNSENYQFDFSASIPKDSDVSFSGANLGDSAHKREIAGKIEVNKNIAKISNLRLIRYIANQNNKINPMVALKANGQILQSNNEIYYNNFKVATNAPINVRILNLIFKKSILKKGNFECNIDLNGNIKTPKVIGKVLLEDLDIPLYDTQVNTIKFNIADKYIDGEILAKNKLSDVKLVLRALNKLKPPYIIEKVDISSNKLDIPEIISSLSSQSTKSDITYKTEIAIKPSDVIIKNGAFDFKEVKYNQVNAQNLKGYFNYKDELFNLRDIDFDIAQGKISATGKYNLTTTKLLLNAQMFECDSNELALEFLNLPNQIYGKMNGNLDLKAKNINTFEGIQNAKLDVDFSINNGKMPKLGSLEYLLRAGNILKNGLLGLSLNNIIQVLTPYKTGQFEQINGNLTINNAEIEKLEIFSQGKNLSLYLNGNYSIFEKFADINIYGKLSQNVQSALGAVGNASVHQFITAITRKNKTKIEPELMEKLNKIPQIETSEPPVFFSAKVLGDINKDNYIKSFNWE